MQTGITITIPKIALLQPSMARRILQAEVGRGLEQVGERIANSARLRVPVDRGILRSSITVRVQPHSGTILVAGTVAPGPQAPYAGEVEHGTPPHWVEDIEGLKGWAKRKFGDANRAYAVRHGIAQRGTKAQPFLLPAAQEVEPQVPMIMEAAVALAVRRLETQT